MLVRPKSMFMVSLYKDSELRSKWLIFAEDANDAVKVLTNHFTSSEKLMSEMGLSREEDLSAYSWAVHRYQEDVTRIV